MRQTFPPKDAERDVVFSATSYLHIALDAASLIPALSSLLKAANQGLVTFGVMMDLPFFFFFFGQVLHLQQEKISISRRSVPSWPVRPLRCERCPSSPMAHPAEHAPQKLEAGAAPGHLGTTAVGRGTRDNHAHLRLLWEASTTLLAVVLLEAPPSPPFSFLLSTPPEAALSPGAAGSSTQATAACANLSTLTTRLALYTELGSFSDSVSLLRSGWRLLGQDRQDCKSPQVPEGQKLQFFSMQMVCNGLLLLGASICARIQKVMQLLHPLQTLLLDHNFYFIFCIFLCCFDVH